MISNSLIQRKVTFVTWHFQTPIQVREGEKERERGGGENLRLELQQLQVVWETHSSTSEFAVQGLEQEEPTFSVWWTTIMLLWS